MEVMVTLLRYNTRVWRQTGAVLTVCLVGSSTGIANDGRPAPVPGSSRMDITGYEWFMISLAFAYGMYLLMRWWRLSRKRQTEE